MVNLMVLMIILALQFPFEVTLNKTTAMPGERFTAVVLIDDQTPIEFNIVPINATWDTVCNGADVLYSCIQDDTGIIHARLRDNHPIGTFVVYFHVDHTVRCTKAGVIVYNHPAMLDVSGCLTLLPIILT